MSVSSPELAVFLHEAGLAGPHEEGEWTRLVGGVSSDIWKVETRAGTFCVKRALAQLRVTDDWKAPVERNAFEWEFMKVARRIAPGQVPEPLVHDVNRGLFAMEWLAPEKHKLWKSELLAGRIRTEDAAAVGDLLGRLHAATARDRSIPDRFSTDANFYSLRIEPYLLTTAARHPDLASRIQEIAHITETTKRTLVHGDVSPKNILIGPKGPILLDAECAWFGDPAFDLAFCLNHLVIKARVVSDAREGLAESFDVLTERYLMLVDWEARAELERRAAALLVALALARVDGKSPVEYLDDSQRRSLRSAARAAIAAAPTSLNQSKTLLVQQ